MADASNVSNTIMIPPRSQDLEKQLIVIHGFFHAANGLRPVAESIQDRYPSCRIWLAEYSSHEDSFKISAAKIASYLRNQPYDFSRTVIFGYSMGGLVGRCMMVNGLGNALVTTCTPHLGVSWWVLPIALALPGPQSIQSFSADLAALNADPNDRIRRQAYHLYGFSYNNPFGGYHDDDTVVELSSALGLKGVSYTHRFQEDYGIKFTVPWEPHLLGYSRDKIGDALDRTADLLSKV